MSNQAPDALSFEISKTNESRGVAFAGSGRTPSLPYKRPMTQKGNLLWHEYVYDEHCDCVRCPQYKVLEYATTKRQGYREYKSKGYICQNCPVRE